MRKDFRLEKRSPEGVSQPIIGVHYPFKWRAINHATDILEQLSEGWIVKIWRCRWSSGGNLLDEKVVWEKEV